MAVDWNAYYEFDGNMGVRLHLDAPLKLTPPLTIFAWCKCGVGSGPTALGPGGTIMSMSRNNDALGRFDQLFLKILPLGGNSAQLVADRSGGIVGQASAYSDPFDMTVWNSLCATYDQAFSQCYVNGLPSGSPSTYSTWPSLTPGETTIGAQAFYVGPQYVTGYSGCIAALTVFNWRLSDADVAFMNTYYDVDALCTLTGKDPDTDVLYLERFDDIATALDTLFGPTPTPSFGFTDRAATCSTSPDLIPFPPVTTTNRGSVRWI